MGRAEGGSCCDSPSLAHHAARFEGRGLSSIGTPSEVVSVTTGVLNPLIGKLTKLLGGEYNNKLTGVMREQASSLKDELSAIKPLLDKMELTDDLDASARNWRDRVRETSYDMENCIDEFMHNTDGAADAEASFVEKMASRIEELKVLAVEANARRREMCKHDDDAINNSTHAHVVADSPISAIRKEVAVLVGIREELVVLLTDPQIELKVVSIVGSADGTMLPKGIQNMKLVRTLHCSGMSEGSLEDIKGLSKLTNLKELELSTPYGQCLTVEGVDTLISSIGLVRDLKHLMLDCDSECDGYERLSDSLSDPPPCLEYLDLETWKLSRVPRWIGELSCLRFLHLFVLHLSSDEVCVLGELPSLISAMLHVSEVSKNKVVVGTGLFPLLEVFWFQSNEDVSTYLSFEAGAMPKLQKLKLGFGWKEWRGATPVGMECLPCLRDIRVWLRYTVLQSSKNEKDVRADVESAFKCAVRRYPKHTSVVVD
ncbi:hypothetical protein ACQ4PT_054020 [Festuca glaucescens]